MLNNAPNGTDPTGMWCIFGLGDCDTDPDLAAVAYYYLVQTDLCITLGDTWCWGGEDQGIDPWDPANNGMFDQDMDWTWYHPAQAWGLPEDSLKTLMLEYWFFEQGPNPREFGQGHPITEILKHHAGVDDARYKFLYLRHCNFSSHWYDARQGHGKEEIFDLALVAIPAHMRVFYETLLKIPDSQASIEGTLGSFGVHISNNWDGTATFEALNITSWSSGSFDLVPNVSRSDTQENWICDEGCGGNFEQRFIWTEPIPAGVCDCFTCPYPR